MRGNHPLETYNYPSWAKLQFSLEDSAFKRPLRFLLPLILGN